MTISTGLRTPSLPLVPGSCFTSTKLRSSLRLLGWRALTWPDNWTFAAGQALAELLLWPALLVTKSDRFNDSDYTLSRSNTM